MTSDARIDSSLEYVFGRLQETALWQNAMRRKNSEAEGKYIRQTGGSGQIGGVKIRLGPQ